MEDQNNGTNNRIAGEDQESQEKKADGRYTLYLNPERKAELQSYIKESGLSVSDAIAQLLDVSSAHLGRLSLNQAQEAALKEVEYHLSTVGNIMSSVMQSGRSHVEALEEEHAGLKTQALEAKAEAREIEKQSKQALALAEDRVKQVEGNAALIREQTNQELNQMRDLVDRERESREQSARLASLAEQAAAEARAKAEGLAELASQAQEYQTERDQLQEELIKKEKDLQTLAEQKERALELAQLEKDRALMVLREQLQSEFQQKLDTKINKIQDKLEAREQKSQAEIFSLRERLDEAKEARTVAERNQERLENNLSSVTIEKQRLEKSNEQLSEKLNSLSAQMDGMREQVRTLEFEKRQAVLDEREKCVNELSGLRENKATMEVQLEKSKNEVSGLREQLHKVTEKLDHLTREKE